MCCSFVLYLPSGHGITWVGRGLRDHLLAAALWCQNGAIEGDLFLLQQYVLTMGDVTASKCSLPRNLPRKLVQVLVAEVRQGLVCHLQQFSAWQWQKEGAKQCRSLRKILFP